MPLIRRIVLLAAAVFAFFACTASLVLADGIDAGLWKITSRTETGGVIGPPHESSKCLPREAVNDIAGTFSPDAHTINSVCAPIDMTYTGKKLTWRLVCKGQLNMELDGEFNFDTTHHYTATVRSKASMAGQIMIDSQQMIEAQWVSECP